MKTRLMKTMTATLRQAPYFGASGLVVSVSGGVDSMVLLDVLVRMAHVHRAPIRVCHVHHGTGRFADVSEKVVRRFCTERELAVAVHRFEEPAGANFEYRAAAFRRRVLEETRREGEWLLLAHHREDQVETLVMALTRGAGIASPIAMRAARDFRARPFLTLDRELVLEHARLAGVPHVLDPSNYRTDHFRNRLRHRVLPEIATVHQRPWSRWGAWLEDFERVQDGLAAEAWRRLDAFLEGSLLARAAFEEAPPYRWDFLLRAFWTRLALPMPPRARHLALRRWIEEKRTGSFRHHGGTCFYDIDGLTWHDWHWPARLTLDRGVPVTWGPLRFVFHTMPQIALEKRDLSPKTIFLACPARLDRYVEGKKRVKETMRRARVPLRIRQMLPLVEIGEVLIHFDEFLTLLPNDRDFEWLDGSENLIRPFFEHS
ncbi:tRNA(Ile)-lysidine synthase [Sulfidibacter corallicola]|uniref:tRNA(Ile)-lysidine synthase n=1 Tax=Sulfidibacter corallicola TaxID=2818388 RepID=A0A8A4THH6_SULCO|nr:tRNA lysidine(34) synthetase TilS [Sulfidibacter corallicola]QTD48654.1 tRNA lysidine(34) synthetase TilS [Sulfidibacter corallicola]